MNGIQGTKAIATQIMNLLERLDKAAFTLPLELFNGSTLGQHFRHILDFYHCLLRGAEQGVVDYADRERVLLLEQDPAQAFQAMERICALVEAMNEEKGLMVRGDFSDTTDIGRPLLHSSIGRELLFAHDHAVHHLAIIRIGLQAGFPEFDLDKNLGIAPSTVKYRIGVKN